MLATMFELGLRSIIQFGAAPKVLFVAAGYFGSTYLVKWLSHKLTNRRTRIIAWVSVPIAYFILATFLAMFLDQVVIRGILR